MPPPNQAPRPLQQVLFNNKQRACLGDKLCLALAQFLSSCRDYRTAVTLAKNLIRLSSPYAGSGLQATPKVTQTEAETVGEDLPTTSPSKKALASEGPAASETLASDPHQGDTGSISQALPAKAQAADVKFGSEPESATPELTPGAHGTEGTVT